jgi:hypothetical protein
MSYLLPLHNNSIPPILTEYTTWIHSCQTCNQKYSHIEIVNPRFGSKPIGLDKISEHEEYEPFMEYPFLLQYLQNWCNDKSNLNIQNLSITYCTQCKKICKILARQVTYKIFGITYWWSSIDQKLENQCL